MSRALLLLGVLLCTGCNVATEPEWDCYDEQIYAQSTDTTVTRDSLAIDIEWCE